MNISDSGEFYSGQYVITPSSWTDIELETQNKVLKDNIVVKEIPYYEIPNVKGGTAAYIGAES